MKKFFWGLVTLILVSNGSVTATFSGVQTESYEDDSMFIKSITLSDWLEKPQTTETMTRIIKIFNHKTASCLKNENIWINGAPYKTVDSIMANSLVPSISKQSKILEIQCSYPIIPHLVKWVIPQDNHYLSIGDLHGNFQALRQIINYMKILKIFKNENEMRLCDNVKMIFLGDYMDRGADSLNVFTTAALLSLKNLGQVLMLKGNHEKMEDNLNKYGLYNEIINKLDPKIQNDAISINEKVATITDELSKAYEFLPVGAFIGYSGALQTKFNFHVHGCIDPRIDYKDILEFDADKLSQDGGIALWQIGSENIMNLEELSFFYKDIVQDTFELLINFNDALKNPDPTSGFMWHDVYWGCGPEFTKSTRGEFCPSKLNANFVKRFAAKFDSANSKICGITRSHQHNLPKELTFIHYSKATPACVIMQDEPMLAKLLYPGELVDFKNNFGIITVMSASIKYPDNEINFPPTFLMTSCGSDGNPRSFAYYNSKLLE